MVPLATLTGHVQRVLYLTLSPDGQDICTGAADETLRFWSIFPKMKRTEFRPLQYSQWMQYR
jgi:cell division cycle 20-like protein 1 (cofactor of APC complex)